MRQIAFEAHTVPESWNSCHTIRTVRERSRVMILFLLLIGMPFLTLLLIR